MLVGYLGRPHSLVGKLPARTLRIVRQPPAKLMPPRASAEIFVRHQLKNLAEVLRRRAPGRRVQSLDFRFRPKQGKAHYKQMEAD